MVDAYQQEHGYSIQLNRMLFRLIGCSSADVVHFENTDDIFVERADGTFLLEQSTSQASNPLKVSDPKTWKTIANWIRQATSRPDLQSHTEFVLYVEQSYIPEPLIASMFSASTTAEAKKALEAVREKFWGSAPSYSKKSSIAENKKAHVNCLLEAPEAISLDVIKAMSLSTGGDGSVAQLKSILKELPLAPNLYDAFVSSVIGTLKTQKDTLQFAGQPFSVRKEDFLAQVRNFNRQFDSFDHFQFLLEPEDAAVSSEVTNEPIYLRQLDLIGLPKDQKIKAARNFLKAKTTKMKMASDGNYPPRIFDEYDANLIQSWESEHLSLMADTYDDIGFGMKLFAACTRPSSLTLGGASVPPDFMIGCFHNLAHCNRQEEIDAIEIGWHKNYKLALKKIFGI